MNEILVVIPHYNDLIGLKNTISSIQESVDILIIDDGSIDRPEKDYLLSFISPQCTLTVLYNERNKGIAYSLNRGIQYCLDNKYVFFARLDAGDYVNGKRFSIQMRYLISNPSIGFCGSWVNCCNEKRQLLYNVKFPTRYQDIKKKIYYYNCFIHPTIMVRSTALAVMGFYPENYPALEDYAFFWRALQKIECSNIEEYLIDYIISNNSVSTKKRRIQSISKLRLSINMFDFSIRSLLGIVKNTFLLLLTRKMAQKIKQYFGIAGL